jgi:hypothetical protein
MVVGEVDEEMFLMSTPKQINMARCGITISA